MRHDGPCIGRFGNRLRCVVAGKLRQCIRKVHTMRARQDHHCGGLQSDEIIVHGPPRLKLTCGIPPCVDVKK
jgi:hypothetical protein